MSSPERKDAPDPETGENSSGPNLIVLYALVAFGALLAMACAAAIVWPFYQRR
ncbi:MAG TPA: hypothetical protein VG893_10105 [Terracidiphilus sp.]|nr:hypothetical protein [Terracidiphilus sp.]